MMATMSEHRFRCPDCGATQSQEKRYPAPRCYECIPSGSYLTATYMVTGKVGTVPRAMEHANG